MSTDVFANPYDGGAGESLDRELARVPVQTAPRDPSRRTIVKVPTIPAGLRFVELEAAAAELERCRAIAANAASALAAAEGRRGGAHNSDLAAGADALRRGDTPKPTAVVALANEIAGLVANRDAARTLVIQCEYQLAAVLDDHRTDYLRRVHEAIADDRADALAALDAYATARGTVLADLTVRNWLQGERKFALGTLPPLRGLVSSDRPAPTAEAVLSALRAELA